MTHDLYIPPQRALARIVTLGAKVGLLWLPWSFPFPRIELRAKVRADYVAAHKRVARHTLAAMAPIMGTCRRCKRKPLDGRKHCQRCTDSHRRRNRAYAAKHRTGTTHRCGNCRRPGHYRPTCMVQHAA